MPLSRLERLGRTPEGNDVVVKFVGNRDLDERDAAFAPVAARGDPGGGAFVVTRFGVLEVVEGAGALQETEAFRVVVNKGGELQGLRVAQRPPQAGFGAGVDGKAVVVVYGVAVVVDGGAAARAEEVH